MKILLNFPFIFSNCFSSFSHLQLKKEKTPTQSFNSCVFLLVSECGDFLLPLSHLHHMWLLELPVSSISHVPDNSGTAVLFFPMEAVFERSNGSAF